MSAETPYGTMRDPENPALLVPNPNEQTTIGIRPEALVRIADLARRQQQRLREERERLELELRDSGEPTTPLL